MTALRLFLFLSFPLLLFSQTARTSPPSRANTAELQKFLALSDDQILQLKQILADRAQALEAAYSTVTAKQKQLTDLLRSGSTDALAIGNLSIEIQRLRGQTIAPSGEQGKSLAVLTAAQKQKLAELQNALLLRQAADQAAAFHLIEYPRTAVAIEK